MTRSDARPPAGRAGTSAIVPTPHRALSAPAAPATVLQPELVDHLTASLAGGRSVLVVGDAGSGKTHAVARTLERLRAQHHDLHIVHITGTGTHDGLPLGALEPLLDDPAAAFGDLAGTLRSLAANLERRRGSGRLVLRVEDAHRLDDASARALDWLVRQDSVQVVATLRQSWAARSPWAALWKDDVVERLDVAPLTREAAERWLTAELGAPVTADTTDRLWRTSGGSATRLREAVHDARASGALEQRNGAWVWRGGQQGRSRTLDLAELDLQGVSTQGKAALEVCAVVCPVALDVLLDLVPAAAVDELVLAGAVTMTTAATVTGGTVRVVDLTMPAYADVARAWIPASRQRELLQRALEAPVAHGVAATSLIRSVSLAIDLGMDVPPARVQEALTAAFTIHQHDSVVMLTTGVLASSPPGAAAAQLHALRGDARVMLTELAEAERDFSRAAELLAEGPLDVASATLLLHVADMAALVAHRRLGDVDRALARLDEIVRPLREADPVLPALRWRDEVEVTRLTRLGYAGRLETIDAALVALEGGAHPARRVSLAPPTAMGLGESGRLHEAFALCTRFGEIAAAHEDLHRWGRGEVLVATFFTLLWSGEVEAVRAALAPTAADAPIAVEWATVHTALGLLAIADGSWNDARTHLATARARFDETDLTGLASYSLTAEATAAAACGDAAAARDLLEQASRASVGSARAMEGDLRVRRLDALSWLRSADLVAEARAVARWARERGAARVELEALHRWIDASRRAGGQADPALVARVRSLGAVCDGARSAALVAHVEALAAQDADLARIAERELNRRGLWLPPLGASVALTSREQEIASLAAGGLTSRAIAQRLVLSTRTVDSHLSRVFAKLGVHSREELANVLR
ncbi:helix-turn-helix transcriptional regulator [Cellulomonas dongxiuzhuiae]|uniref:AAA family ATPase n=1 Tax=Cellulomonas dongxiuzhuiae TaxID=2819979 RepID=A0ABX8GHJ1_9CELL|nr:LuxR C-terminal-related transcriptional regulator [Cellulomonas dongxiuzhuiae]MBO3094627.1 AAA family ATPase [Cellulomonas dongxiuzhuiae]QWC15638.1 AAA family ATPase [Cellulomonas dongxiuzhuiae]